MLSAILPEHIAAVSVESSMKKQLLRVTVLAAVAAGTGSIFLFSALAQQTSPSTPRSSALTTNWIGSLVAGQPDTADRIAPGPHPTVLHQIEIGLRSDGALIWRNAPR